MKKVTVKSLKEFKERVESKDIDTVVEIFNGVKRGIKKKYSTVTIFDVYMEEDPTTVYKFKLEKNQWPVALRACLNVFSDNDMFEECIEIQKLVKELEVVDIMTTN